MARKRNIEEQLVVANCDHKEITLVENCIFTLRGEQVILDSDLAKLYGAETKRFNEQVHRNINRFPTTFMFQLTSEEWDSLRSQFATINGRGQHRKYLPYAFTEHGVIMAAAILKSEMADRASVKVVEAFVAMRRFLSANAQVFQRLETIEYKLLESDQKFEDLYSKLEEKSLKPQQGIFFEGQVYDAYELICNLLKSASSRIILIDNYVDESVLTMLDKRPAGVSAAIYTQKISAQLALDIAKHDAQYPPIPVLIFNKSHDRFLIIDNRVFHIGASIKDLGKKWFAILEMEDIDTNDLISRL
jgi:hypothetical protein